MPKTGFRHSTETKEKIRLAKLGQAPWNKGLKGIHLSPDTEFKPGDRVNLGRHWTEERKAAKSRERKGYRHTDEAIEDIKRNHARYWKGRKRDPEMVEKMRQSKLGKPAPWNAGERSHFWNGGTGHEPYPARFSARFKRLIRERDKYLCRVCGTQGSRCVHHIDYDKTNCAEGNLVTLCQSCHSKTLFGRDDWTHLLSYVMASGLHVARVVL